MKKILVVDDEEVIRLNIEAFLEDEGYDVFSASTGAGTSRYLPRLI